MVHWAYMSQPPKPKRHLHRMAVFAGVTRVTSTRTGTQTTLRATSVTMDRIYAIAMRPINSIQANVIRRAHVILSAQDAGLEILVVPLQKRIGTPLYCSCSRFSDSRIRSC